MRELANEAGGGIHVASLTKRYSLRTIERDSLIVTPFELRVRVFRYNFPHLEEQNWEIFRGGDDVIFLVFPHSKKEDSAEVS